MELLISFFLGVAVGHLSLMLIVGIQSVRFVKAKQENELPRIPIRVTDQMFLKIKDCQRRGIDWQGHAQTGALLAIQALMESED